MKSAVGDYVGDALPFSWFEGDVPVGEHDQHWNVPGPEDRVDLRDVCGVGMLIIAGNHLGEGGYPPGEAAVGWGILYCSNTPASRGRRNGQPRRKAIFLNRSSFLIRKLEKPPFRNTKVNSSGTGVVLTRVFKITNDLT